MCQQLWSWRSQKPWHCSCNGQLIAAHNCQKSCSQNRSSKLSITVQKPPKALMSQPKSVTNSFLKLHQNYIKKLQLTFVPDKIQHTFVRNFMQHRESRWNCDCNYKCNLKPWQCINPKNLDVGTNSRLQLQTVNCSTEIPKPLTLRPNLRPQTIP